VSLGEINKDKPGAISTTGFVTVLDWRAQSRSLESIAAMSYWTATITSDGPTERYEGMRVSHEFFKTLGVTPMLGRDFTAEDDVPAHRRRAILSYSLWQQRFHGDPSVVGRFITLSGVAPYEVLGVLPRDFVPVFSGPTSLPTEIWGPLAYDTSLPQACRSCRHLRVVGLLAQGATPTEARAEMATIFTRQAAAYPNDYDTIGAGVESLKGQIVGPIRPTLLALWGAVIFVLLIACANVAHLQMAGMADRHREFAIRLALGASRRHLVAQLLVESVAIAIIGGALGLLVAKWGVAAAIAVGPPSLPQLASLRVDVTLVLFLLAASTAAGILTGLGPALVASRGAADDSLKSGGRVSGAPSRRRFRQVVILSDVALALVLLTGAGLMLKSVGRLLDVNPGFDRHNLLTMQLDVSGPAFDASPAGQARLANYYQDVLDRVGSIGGVTAAGAVSQLPLGGNFDRYLVEFDGRPVAHIEDLPTADHYIATSSYLATMRIPVVSGRGFSAADVGGGDPVVLIAETFARRWWPGVDPIGTRIRIGGPTAKWLTVVGVVGDVRHEGLDVGLTNQIYVPFSQFVDSTMMLVVRGSADAAGLEAPVRGAIWSIDRNQPILRAATMDRVVEKSLATRRFAMLLLECFAGVAFVLAAMGIYGVIASSVTQQTREIGVRLALGASPGRVVSSIVVAAARVTAAGLVAGILLAILLTRYLSSLLFGVSPTDVVTFAVVAGVVGAMGLLAACLPAAHAARVDPLTCLRSE
jgi:putative ABC transport system permease protein